MFDFKKVDIIYLLMIGFIYNFNNVVIFDFSCIWVGIVVFKINVLWIR